MYMFDCRMMYKDVCYVFANITFIGQSQVQDQGCNSISLHCNFFSCWHCLFQSTPTFVLDGGPPHRGVYTYSFAHTHIPPPISN